MFVSRTIPTQQGAVWLHHYISFTPKPTVQWKLIDQSHVYLLPRDLIHSHAQRAGSGDEAEAVDWSGVCVAPTTSLGVNKVHPSKTFQLGSN